MSAKTVAGPILLVAPAAPPYGGMAIQAALLAECLRRDGAHVVFFASNFVLPGRLAFLDRLPGIRTILRAVLIWVRLWPQLRQAQVIHVLAASWLYFFVVVGPAVVLGRIHRKRIVLNYRGGGAQRFFESFGWAAKPFFRAATVVTAPSDFLAGIIRNHFDIPVAIVPNILDLSLFRYRPRTFLEPKFLVARHLEKIYDIESVLRAFQIVQAHRAEATLRIVGTGSQEEHLKSLVQDLALRNVRFVGHVAHEDLAAIYDRCDVFVNASRVDNFPGALLEASAAGLAIVSTGAGGIPFIYENRKSALLVHPGDWQGLAEAAEELLQSPSLASRLIAEAATIARACDWVEVRKPLYVAYGFSGDDFREGVPPAALCQSPGQTGWERT
jgi:L-malate glycosyltransferase